MIELRTLLHDGDAGRRREPISHMQNNQRLQCVTLKDFFSAVVTAPHVSSEWRLQHT